jgi:spore germination protein GerM
MLACRHRAPVVIACLITLAAAGCGVRTQSEPSTIDRDDVPFGLLRREPPTGPGPSVPGSNVQVLYVVGEDGIVATRRTQAQPPTLTDTVRSLVKGVTAEEAALGFRSAIPPGTTVRHVATHGDVATIDLGGAFDQVDDDARTAAFAQIVFTATETPPVTHVRFELNGHPIDVPTVDGRLTSEPVSRGDYALTDLLSR